MRKIILLALLLVLIVNFVHADYFQIVFKSNGDRINVAYAEVKVIDGNDVVFEGYTDKYGRIVINLPNKEYEGQVFFRKQWREIRLKIDGSENLKVIYI